MKAILNKTGVTTTQQITNILLGTTNNSSLTFEDLATQWYKDFLVYGHSDTDNTGLFIIGIFAAYRIDKLIG